MISEPFRCLPPFFRLVRVTQNGRPQIYQFLHKTGLFVEEKNVDYYYRAVPEKELLLLGEAQVSSYLHCTALHCTVRKEEKSTVLRTRAETAHSGLQGSHSRWF
jgi:hypothetical protein